VPWPAIDVYSDPICPWCMIGRHRLARALKLAGGGTSGPGPAVRWRVFQLNPSMPAGGMDRTAYLAAKFGGAVQSQEVYRAIRKEGEAEGVRFAFDRIRRTPNTLKAHLLIRLAAGTGAGDAMAGRLFDAYFLEGRDIGDSSVLVELAADAGIAREVAQAWLEDEETAARLSAEDAEARASGISGVPYFVIGGRYSLAGAAPPEVLVRAMELAAQTVS
jgi:predicted DsbA family dithiol-disulfide isomerase